MIKIWQSLRNKIEEKLQSELEGVRKNSLKRAEREEQRKYSGWKFRAFAALLLIILSYAAYLMFDPGAKIYSMGQLKAAGLETYALVTHGKLLRTKGSPPFDQVDEVQDYAFNIETERWPKYFEVLSTGKETQEFWYSFEVDLSENKLSELVQQEEIGILFPKVFGHVTVFRDGEKFDFRRDFWPLAGLSKKISHFDIHVQRNLDDPRTPGIVGFYPILVGKFSDLEKITRYIGAEMNRRPIALVMQIVALLIVSALASSGPYMAELWPLIVFFLVNIVDCGFALFKEQGTLPFSMSQNQYFFIKVLMTNAQGLVFLWFNCEFFRQNSEEIKRKLSFAYKAWCCVQVIGAFLIFRTFQGISEPWVVFIVLNYAFFLIATLATCWRDFYFVCTLPNSRERAALSIVLLCSIGYFYVSGIYNYLHLSGKTTSEFAIQFSNYIVMAVITAIELGRSNRQRDEQRKNLPKEVTGIFQETFDVVNYQVHRGFVLLCDGVGYSVKIGKLKSMGPELRAHFQCAVLHVLLKCFYHPSTSNHSMTGDGFYFGIPWDWNVDNLRNILLKCQSAIDLKLQLKSLGISEFDSESMTFRCNLAYGEYSNSQVIVNNLGAVVASSDLHTYLARTAGSKGDPVALRVYLNGYTKGFGELPFGKRVKSNNKSVDEPVSEAVEFSSTEITRILAEGWLEQIVKTAELKTILRSAA
jgi:hypothetical protein